MPKNPMSDAVFTKPTIPKNSRQLLSWVIFEPILLTQYSNTLSRKEGLWVLLKVYPLLVTCSCLLYLLSSAVVVGLDLPQLFPGQFKTELVDQLSDRTSFFDGYAIFIKKTMLAFIIGFAGCLILGFAGGLTRGFFFGIALGLTGGVASGLLGGVTSDLTFGLVIGIAFGLVGSLIFGLAGSLLFSLAESFGVVLILGFAGILVWDLIWNLPSSLAWGLGFYIGYFRLLFYPFYYFFKMDFYHAPYFHDAAIWLPIWQAKTRLCALALDDPETAIKFAGFLRIYRPLQTKLSDTVFHAIFAGTLLKNPVDMKAFELPPLIIKNSSLRPSNDWYNKYKSVKNEFSNYIQHNNIHLKQQSCGQLITELNDFKEQTSIENPSWRGYYLSAIEKWLRVANEELGQLEVQAKTLEPITANVYLSGDALNPTQHKAIFFGRNDLKDQFARSVLTATQMPMFLIQGQRRTGKTSLLNFLEPLLGAGFEVLKQDLQDAQFDSIPHWLADLQRGISDYLITPQPEPSHSDNWLHCWQAVQACLSQFVGGQYRLILAFDEYEAIHSLLQQDPIQGERLLAAMRSYSQQQNKVVFLFVGAALFSELEQPNWSRYFVQVQRFRVDYLHHDDAIRLITEPVNLSYPPAVCERMFDLTQGHPALLQLLCSKMVDIANSENRKAMQAADLDAVVRAVSTERETLAILIFWRDFCADPACKQTVKQLLNGERVAPNPHLYRLEEHGFIVEKEGRWQLRVPLFEMWLQRFADRV
ncbi:MAG: hypothetical protein NTV43_15910 [Methylococcales bacterium]|nr:hypothetical protein [Methylococcales bacterium]